uniref:Ig-like domain-containing protein n=1 Tax=Pelusios castaneus TaxID=367368 RepID=A0A8C8SHS1_9SAUR
MRRTRFVSPPLNAGLFVNPEGPYPKPSISVSPAGVIPVGGNVTIRCWQHHYPGLRIQLYRDGIWNYLNYMDPAGSEAEFPIPSVSREHGGSYQCRYSDISGTYSEPSDPVEIIVGLSQARLRPTAGLSYPEPGPSGVGGEAGFWAWGSGMLEGISARGPDLSVAGAVCLGRTGLGAGPGLVLTAHVLCADPGLPRPAISLRPSSVPAPGANVTIRCEGPGRAVRFFLHKAGDLNLQEHVDPAGDWTEFRIPDVGRHHGGRYSCSYRPRSQPFVSSEPSDPMELLVAGEGPNSASRLPAPHADNRTPWGGDCSPVGHMNTQEHVDPAGDWAEFRIPDVGRHHGGRYSCSYRPRLQPFVSSEPSDPVELLVAGEGPNSASRLPAPHADNRTPWGGDCSSVGCPEPGSVLSPRAQQRDTRPGNRDGVTGGEEGTRGSRKPRGPSLARQICAAWGWVPGRYRALAGSEAEFPIPSLSREHGGSYWCRYIDRSGNYSEPSDPVEIIVAGEPGPGSPLPTPPPVRPQGSSTSPGDAQHMDVQSSQ